MTSLIPNTPPPNPSSVPAALTLAEVVEMTGGRLLKLGVDRENLICQGASPPVDVRDGEITMIDQASNASTLKSCSAIAVVTPEELEQNEANSDLPAYQIICENVHEAFAKLVCHFRPPLGDCVPGARIDPTAKVDPSAHIHPSVMIGAGASVAAGCEIHANVTIGAGCQIDEDCVLHPNVVLYAYTQIGKRVTIHSGTVIGAHGFGYKTVDGKHLPSSQLGYVVIEADVEVGACVTIDRGTYGATRIGEGTKIDNQVQVAHNCQIGKHNLLCSQVGVAGSCRTGDYVVLAGQVGLKDHITLDEGVIVAAQSGVMHNLASGQVYMGTPATTIREHMQTVALEKRLPDMRRELKKLAKQVKTLSEQVEASAGQKAESSDQSRRAA